jgi:group I intron endonuclease
MNFVYLTTNLVNGKQYIGSHYTNNLNDNYLGSGKALHLAIRKYGRNNFKREILQECESIEEARRLEEHYIHTLNTLSPNGYNISEIGGSGITGKSWGVHSEITKQKIRKSVTETLNKPEVRQKISEAISGEKNGFYNKQHSEETKRKIREKNKGRKHTKETIEKMKESHKGKRFSKEHKSKLSESKKGSKNPMFGKSPHNTGKRWSEEVKRKISETLKNKKIIKSYNQ